MLIFSPLFYIYLVLYLITLFSLTLMSNSFLFLWLLMEAATLFFWAIVFISSSSVYSSNVLYFLYQSLASLSILFMYFLGVSTSSPTVYFVLLMFVLMKLGLSPLNGWYFFSLSLMSKLPMFMALTLQKLPPLFIFSMVSVLISESLGTKLILILLCVFFSSCLSMYFAAMSHVLTLTHLLLVSSLFNTVWLTLSSVALALTSSPYLVVFYLSVYSMALFPLLFELAVETPLFTLCFYTMMGFPPLPLFFAKVAIVSSAVALVSLSQALPLAMFMFLLLIFNGAMLLLYFYFMISPLKSRFAPSYLY